MRQLFIFVFLIFFTSTIWASAVTVKGKLVSVSDQKGLPFATISIVEEDTPNVVVKKLATQEDGAFSTTLDPGKYLFSFHYVGMDQIDKAVEVPDSRQSVDLGSIGMAESSTELDEISVVAQTPLVKVEIDKLIYNAKDDPESSTSSVLDLLRKVPLVTVDGEDEIQLKGSSNFKIYMNGKPSNMITSNPAQVLKSMPANSVKNVEVITDPGAKYDAEGIGGIINIVTDKRADDGYSGSVGANGDTFGGYGGNAYLATKYGKFGFTGNTGYYHFRRPASESTFIRQEFSPSNQLSLDGSSKGTGGGLYMSGALSFEPDTLNLFNVSASRFGGEFTSKGDQLAQSFGARSYSYETNTNSVSQYGGVNLSADYQRNFKRKGELLTVSYRFEHNPNDSEYESGYENVEGDFYYPDGYKLRSENNAGGDEHTGQVDYVNPLNGKHNIEAGLKYIYRDNSSNGNHTFYDVANNSWSQDVTRKNDLEHKQNIFSGYAGYGYKMGKVGAKLGLRAEHTQQDIRFVTFEQDTPIETSFFDLVPSGTVSYQLGMTRTIRGGYNMRISRPGIWVLNPYVNDVDPNNISYGNPQLDAEQQHNFDLNYGSFSQKLNFNATLSYSFAQNAVTNYSFIERTPDDVTGIEKSVTHTTYANIGKNSTVGTNMYISWTPTQMIRAYVNGGVNYTEIESTENSELRNSGFSGRAFGGVTLTFPKDFRVGVNTGVFSSRVQLQTDNSVNFHYNFHIMKSLLDKKMDLSLGAQSIFSKYRESTSTTTGDGFMQKSRFLNPMRNVRLSITYRFGDLKTSMKRVQRSISNDDVMQNQQNGSQGGSTTTEGGSR